MNRRYFLRSLGLATFALTLRLRPESVLPVAKDPAVLWFKGDQFLTSGYVDVPYYPIYVTRDIRLSDFAHTPVSRAAIIRTYNDLFK